MRNPAVDSGGGRLAKAVGLLQRHMLFDAALLVHQPAGARSRIVSRLGYSQGAAWALQHLFPRDYEVGFTARLNPDDHLPLSISDVRVDIREQFTRTVLFRRYLRAEGYADGMSVELFDDGDYVGVAHFSARRPDAFGTAQRALAQDLSGLLALALRHGEHAAESPAERGVAGRTYLRWGPDQRIAEAARAVPFLDDPAFARVVDAFLTSALTELRHLWLHQRAWYRVVLARRGDFGDLEVCVRAVTPDEVWRLSAQELRVLSGLVVGRTDAEIAADLSLSPRTVHAHMVSIRRKLGVTRRTEAAARATATATFVPGPATAPVPDLARIYRDTALS
ncbi:helix-turn-helix transcriptional regulator [Nocardia farcinica]|uniref:helix-turn-helix transcriptional regulator n=1 Tax=Nocardia farcinica TaxID=37329 RepID=UPI001895B59E|nr:helix-turn-helix transcriptional regulator [Nocardia farcinica]MBF6234916.1 helix-turn-helix transcriptional regulator [Nocardia farcinica]